MPAFSRPGHRHARLAALLPALAVAATGLLALAPAARAGTATAISVAVPSTAAPGSAVKVTAHLAAGSDGLSNKAVDFLYLRSGARSWEVYRTARTNVAGNITVAYTARYATHWKARFRGDGTYAAATSAWATCTPRATVGQKAVGEASRHRGAPYQYGAVGPYRFDCSGFTRYVWSRFGRSLPHNSGQQYTVVHHVARNLKQPGDLLFFYGRGGIYHVGIYAGSGQFWHAPHSGTSVRREAIYSSSYYVGRVA